MLNCGGNASVLWRLRGVLSIVASQHAVAAESIVFLAVDGNKPLALELQIDLLAALFVLCLLQSGDVASISDVLRKHIPQR